VSSEDVGDDLVVVRAADVEDAESVRVDDGEGLGAPVDRPDEQRTLYGTVTAWETAKRRPIVAAWVRNQQQRVAFVRWLVDYTWYGLRLHLFHSPKYLGKTAWYAPVGVLRLLGRLFGWWFDAHGFRIEQEAVNVNDSMTFFKARREVNARRLFRGIILGAGVVGLLVAYFCLRIWAPWWAQAGVLVVAVSALARAGRPAGKPIIDRITEGPAFVKLTAELTRRAVLATGKVKDPAGITFPVDIGRDGPGQRAILDLPDGVIATDIIDERDRLAGGFRLPKVQVWPAMMPREHPGRLEIWVADRPLDRLTPPTFPLLKAGQTDYFKAVPVGYDPRLRTQVWEFAQKNSLLAGIPGSGKSLDARVLILAGILDPLVIPAAFELKGTGDYKAIKPMCPEGMYGSGADQATKQAMFDFLMWLEDECDRRGPLVEKYAAMGISDTNNVNRAMAEKDPRLRPIVAVLDEIQELFTDPELGKPAKAKAISIVKRGRALAIHLIPATQRIDKESIPRGLSSNIALRACGAVTAYTECDMVLGTGAYSRGARPTEFETAVNDDPKDSGWVWRVGLGPMAPMRFYYISNKQAEQIADRAMRMREALDPVDVAAVKVQAYNLLDDIHAVWPAGQDKAWSEVLLKGLAGLRPQVYGEWTTDTLAKALKGYLVTTAQTWGTDEAGKGANRRGITRADLMAAITSQREGQKTRQAPEIEID
jgi:S-DNA-T family DNA segregation ATPase FtsK/SpoIIIE